MRHRLSDKMESVQDTVDPMLILFARVAIHKAVNVAENNKLCCTHTDTVRVIVHEGLCTIPRAAQR